MNCPVCNVPLIAVERERIEVDYCISCRGLWFDSGELELLCEALHVPFDPGSLTANATAVEKQRRCPRCGKAMLKNDMAARGVIVDRCPAGEGIWFDARELGAFIDQAAQREGDSRPVATFLGEMFGKP